jgi:EAL domain-containing protein (putative c-di-GMP-specific phosphodiesterase class I)
VAGLLLVVRLRSPGGDRAGLIDALIVAVGYSSLSYLHRFPVHLLKIDKSFVKQLDDGLEDSALARAVVRLGQTLHLETVAEGIETAAQADALRDLGCTFGQGYHFAKPLEAGEVEELLEAGGVVSEPARGAGARSPR